MIEIKNTGSTPMNALHIDIETYCSVDITSAGLYKYAESPDFEVLLFGYAFEGQEPAVVSFAEGERLPPEVYAALFDPEVTKFAYNAAFEWRCLSRWFGVDPAAWLSQWRCVMHHGLYCGYPAGLAAASEAMGLSGDKRKMSVGSSLIRTFCAPQSSRKGLGFTRTLPAHEPELWALFKEYCRRDVAVEMEIEGRLAPFPVPDYEVDLWRLDQGINARGVAVDLPLVDAALQIHGESTDELLEKAREITGIDNPRSIQKLTKWLSEETGEHLPDLQKSRVEQMLSSPDLTGDVEAALRLRREFSKTSVKKYAAIRASVCGDGRLRGLFQFYGACRTGRWAGRLCQVQNLPKSTIDAPEGARELLRRGEGEALSTRYGSVADALSGLIRTAFVPSQGCVLLVADYSAIEARIIAHIAGEGWRQEVFATHGRIYEASAAAMFGVPLERIQKGNPEYALRQKGKIAELALGYQGGSAALLTMGALAMGLSQRELPDIVARWRQANPSIVALWREVERAAVDCLRTGIPKKAGGVLFSRERDYITGREFLTLRLPSGRKLYYAEPFLSKNHWGREALYYYGTESKTKKWGAIPTYGGKLTENIVQAIARDCLAVGLTRLESAGYPVVMHIHDEVVIDYAGENPAGALAQVCKLMCQPIPWAQGLHLKAEGFVSGFYKKG